MNPLVVDINISSDESLRDTASRISLMPPHFRFTLPGKVLIYPQTNRTDNLCIDSLWRVATAAPINFSHHRSESHQRKNLRTSLCTCFSGVQRCKNGGNIVPKSPGRFRMVSGGTADPAQSATLPQPDTQRRLICVARAPNDLLLAHLRAAGWEVTVARTAPGAEAATKEARVAAGLIDFDGFTPRDCTALRACLSQPTIGWVAVTAADQSASHAVRDRIRKYCVDYGTM